MPNPIEMLKKKVAASSQSAVARDIGCSLPYLCMVLKGDRAPAGVILEYLDLERVERITYRRRGRNGRSHD